MDKTSLGDRMKTYENCYRQYLPENLPIIVRIDMRAGHTFTHGFQKPFDPIFMDVMIDTAQYLCKNISGCKLAYTQSDEISLVLTNNDTKETQPWFGNNLNKIVSLSASLATLAFNKFYSEHIINSFDSTSSMLTQQFRKYSSRENTATFDSRAFILPEYEVENYMIFRQQDCIRNSILSVAQSLYSPKQLHGIKCNELLHKMLVEKDLDWNDCSTIQKRGTCIVKHPTPFFNALDGSVIYRDKWMPDYNIPIFTDDISYIPSHVFPNKV